MHRLVMGLPTLALLVSGCGGSAVTVPRPTVYAPATEEEATAAAERTTPTESRELRFRWQFRDDRGAAGGRGRIRLAVLDSVRLDVTGPLGSGHAAAFVLGDTAIWAQPEEDVKKLVPNYSLFWAMLGIARRPPAGTTIRKFGNETVSAWQYHHGADTLDYVTVAGSPKRFYAEVRQGGKTTGTVETQIGADGRPISARLIVPSVPARLDITFYSNVKAKPFAADTWTPPEP
ncbi:MAG: hypothetical protein ABI647_08200 [Gemmatimonadota bacterium]